MYDNNIIKNLKTPLIINSPLFSNYVSSYRKALSCWGDYNCTKENSTVFISYDSTINLYFFKKWHLPNFVKAALNSLTKISFFLESKWFLYKFFKFITFVGLGYKKRSSYFFKNIYLYFGHRHWVSFAIPKNMIFLLIKRKSLILYSSVKTLIRLYMSRFKDFRKESMFKVKGLLDIRSKKRWVFMRRARLRGIKIKLSKKQKFV